MYDKFRQIIEKKGITAYQVSKGTGVATATLTSWKNGEYTPKMDKLQKIAKYLDVKLEDLIEEVK